MPDGFNETPVRGKHLHNGAVPDETALAALPAVASNTDPTYTEGNVVALSTDLGGNLRVVISASENGQATQVDLTDQADRLVGVVSLDTATITALNDSQESVDLNAATRDDLVGRLSANLESIDLNAATRDDLITRIDALTDAQTDALLAGLEAVSLNADTRDDLVTRLSDAIETSAAASRAALESVDLNVATRDDLVTRLSANLESIDLNAPTLAALERTTPQVRGADVDDNNPLPVNIQTNPGTLVDSGLLTVPDVAPGATVTLDGAVIGAGLTGRLVEMTAASSVRIKVTLRRMGTGAADMRVFFVDPTSSSLVYLPVDRDAITAAPAGRFRISITNMDNLRTADVYGSLTHVEF